MESFIRVHNYKNDVKYLKSLQRSGVQSEGENESFYTCRNTSLHTTDFAVTPANNVKTNKNHDRFWQVLHREAPWDVRWGNFCLLSEKVQISQGCCNWFLNTRGQKMDRGRQNTFLRLRLLLWLNKFVLSEEV